MATTSTPPCELITIPISHYCEKARWALDRAGIAYRERAHLQVIHRFVARRAGGRTVPVLVCRDRVLTESADILDWADERTPPALRLFPADVDEAAEVRALERDFDERLGPEGRLWIYDALRGRSDLAAAYGCTGVPAWQRRLLPLTYRPMMRVVDHLLDVSPETAARSQRVVRDVFDAVAERLSDGRTHLCGDAFGAADLTFAALAAPMVLPREYGVPLPSPDELPAAAAMTVRELRDHPAGRHALAMYARERR